MDPKDMEAWRAQIDLLTSVPELDRVAGWVRANLDGADSGILLMELAAKRKRLVTRPGVAVERIFKHGVPVTTPFDASKSTQTSRG
jgi:hypothetical protein